MTLLQKLKRKLGLADAEETTGAEAEVTIEREADEASDTGDVDEGAEAGGANVASDTSDANDAGEETAEPAAESTEGAEPTEATGPESDDAEATDDDAPSVDTVKGIGPAYAERLSELGIETVADLAAADPAEVGEGASVGEKRAATWIDRASEE